MTQRSKHHKRTAATSSAGKARPFSPAQQLKLAGAGLIALAAVLAYLPSLNGGFILDDSVYLTDCSLITASDGLIRFWFTTEPVDYWPVTNSSFWIEWRLWRMNPTGYHVTNLILHIASSLLIWLVLSRLSIPGAWLAALLFAVHPVNVESVAWIAQRKNTLSLLFFLLSILWYLQADTGDGRWYWLSLLAFTLAMLSKGSVAILPLVLLLIAWWQRNRITSWDLLRTAPFFLVSVALVWVNIWFQSHGSDQLVRVAGFADRLLGAGAVVWFYLYKALLPVDLVFIYPRWNIQANDWRWWVPLVAAVAVTALLLWQRHHRLGRPLLFAWLFFCVALVPVMGFTDVGFMKHSLVADHYQHIAIIGVVALVAAAWSIWRRQLRDQPRRWALAPAVAVVGALLLLSWRQSSLYADAVTLYETTLVDNPESWIVHNNLGNVLTARGKFQQAIEHLQEALRLKPDYRHALNNLGNALAESGRGEEAAEIYRQILRLMPRDAKAHNNLANVLSRSGRLDQAIEHFQQAVRLKPDFVDAHFNLAGALRLSGQPQEAIESYRTVLQLNPYDAEAYNSLGPLLAQSGRIEEAILFLQQGVRLIPASPELHNNLAIALLTAGHAPESIKHLQNAIRLQPKFIAAYTNLAQAYSQLQQTDQAVATAQKALELARSSGQTELARQIQASLDEYRAKMSKGDSENR